MADPGIEVVISEEGEDEMGNVENNVSVSEPSGLENIEPIVPERLSFLSYLRSPIVELVVSSSSGGESTTLFAHQELLVRSPYFAEMCGGFGESTAPRRIHLADEDLAACGSFLEYLYRDDYAPRVAGNGKELEADASVPQPDHDGVALLRHARVYTLAQRFGVPALVALAHRKIHLTQSTATGEIAYARFVYRETGADDVDIRRPVASFWAARSHVLRHEAEHDFKRMCLEFPQFGFDVLSLVLDAQEKRSQRQDGASAPSASARKRQRLG